MAQQRTARAVNVGLETLSMPARTLPPTHVGELIPEKGRLRLRLQQRDEPHREELRMTGTSLDLTPFGALVKGIGVIYWVLAALGLWWALRGHTRWRTKLLRVIPVVLLFGFTPARTGWETYQARIRLDAATARFEMRCKSAGEKITRTVENVDGIFIVNQRTRDINFADQYRLDDPYGYAGSGDNYIRLFLRGRPMRALAIGDAAKPDDLVRYRFVEVASADGSSIFRYTTPMGKIQSEAVTRNGGGVVPLERETLVQRAAKYGIAWADISTPDDRSQWIAGGRMQIIDLVTHEVIAEHVGYMFDRGLGDTRGGRSPWALARANACPPLDEKTFYFFDRVLVPAKGETK